MDRHFALNNHSRGNCMHNRLIDIYANLHYVHFDLKFPFYPWGLIIEICAHSDGLKEANKIYVSIHKAPHLLCSRALEVQKGPSARPVPRIYGTEVNAYRSVFYNTSVVSTP